MEEKNSQSRGGMGKGAERRQRARQLRRRKQSGGRTISLLIGAGVLAVVGYLIWGLIRPSLGEEVAIMDSTEHMPDGTEIDYSSNPPTSGPHYSQPMPGGFYDPVADPGNFAFNVPHPESYIVHSMEHGYVIFWYNCSILTEEECAQLKAEIRAVMDADPIKVLAFPWDSTDVPVVMTSWGRMLRMEEFDAAAAARFVTNNRNRSPEPGAP